MELRHLRYFMVVAEELNVRRAAQHLHLSQPPLSQQIRDLEAELGTKLFDRGNRRLVLTPAGKSFSKEAREILARVERAAQLALAASRGEAGQLKIACLPPMGGLFLPSAMRDFRERFPVVDLTILDMAPWEQITALMDGRIDLGFMPLQVVERNSELEFEPMREVHLMVGLPPGHRLAKHSDLPCGSWLVSPLCYSIGLRPRARTTDCQCMPRRGIRTASCQTRRQSPERLGTRGRRVRRGAHSRIVPEVAIGRHFSTASFNHAEVSSFAGLASRQRLAVAQGIPGDFARSFQEGRLLSCLRLTLAVSVERRGETMGG